MTRTVLQIATAPQIRSEAAECRLGDDLASRAGLDVVSLSAPHRQLVTRGIPDRRYRHRTRKWTFWFEWKAADGKLTKSQHEFLAAELVSGEIACCGTLDDFSRIVIAVSRSGATTARAIMDASRIVDAWARKGYRPEQPTRRSRRGA